MADMTSEKRPQDRQAAKSGAAKQIPVDSMIPEVYNELRAVARRYMRRERAEHTLQATALVHEAYLRLVEQDRAAWNDRSHFLALAAQAIRRILVDHARRHGAEKRGARHQRIVLSETMVLMPERGADVLAIDEALRKFASLDERRARVVELRFFAGLSIDETARVLGVSKWTVVDDWELARAWLLRELGKGDAS